MIVSDTARLLTATSLGIGVPRPSAFPTAPPAEVQAAILAAFTCPAPCGLLSQRIMLVATSHALTEEGLAVTYAEFCVCERGHWWPHVQADFDDGDTGDGET